MFEITKIKIRNNLVSDECELLFRQYYYWFSQRICDPDGKREASLGIVGSD